MFSEHSVSSLQITIAFARKSHINREALDFFYIGQTLSLNYKFVYRKWFILH